MQNFVKDKAITYLKNKTHTDVSLESIKIALPKDIVINKFFIADLKGDTLLYAGKLSVDISLFKLLSNTVEINNVDLAHVRANVTRVRPDTTFNFSFIVDAFASEQKKPADQVKKDSTSTMKFSINKVNFEDIGLHYRDDVSGNDAKIYIGKFDTKIKDFDLANQHYVIKTLTLKNTGLTYLQQKPLIQLVNKVVEKVDSSKNKAAALPIVEIQKFSVDNVKVNYQDELSTTKAIADINDLGFVNLKVDLGKSGYSADEAHLKKSNILFAFKPQPAVKDTIKRDTVAGTPSSLALNINKVDFADNSLQFDNLPAKPQAGLDFNHLKITGLNLGADSLSYSAQGIKANVTNGSLKDKSGFQLDVLKGNAIYNDKEIKLSNFILKTPNTSIQNNTQLNFTSIDDLTKQPEKVKLNIVLKNTVIGLKDASYFSKAIPANYADKKLNVNASVNGYLNNLQIPKLQINGLTSTQVDISGTAKGLPDMNKLFLDLKLNKVHITKSDLLVLIPKKSLPPSINLPNVIDAKGTFKGSLTNFNTNINVRTDLGGADLKAKMSGPKGREKYAADISLNNFNLGRLLKRDSILGRVTLKANVEGTGLDPKKIDAKLKATVISAYYNKYTYRNLKLDGSYANQKVNIISSMPDSNANFALNAKVNLAGKYPAINADLDLKRVDLQALNFSKTVLQAAGKVTVDLATADADYLNGSIDVTGMQVVKDQQKINLDTISVRAKATETANELTLKSEILSAKIDGKYQLTKIGDAIINQINQYYKFGEVKKIPAQRFRFALQVYDSKTLKSFVPALTVFKSATFNGLIDTQKDSLQIHGNFPQIVYGDFKLDSTTLNIDNKDKKLTYALNNKSFVSPSVQLFGTEVNGAAAINKLDVNIFLKDRQLKTKYALAGVFESINKDFKFSLDPNKILLNYEKWTVSPQNYIQFGASGILVNQFDISNNGQSLSINSNPTKPNSPINLNFKDFQLETLTKFAETDTTLVGGKLNGTANVKDLAGSPKFEANLTVDNLRYLKDELGTLRLAVNNNKADAFEVNVALSGVHDLRVNGFYYTKPTGKLDLTVNVDKIDLSKVQSLSAGQIKNGTGTLSGALTVKGAIASPSILGDLTFNNAGLTIAYVNSYFRMPNEKISFTPEGIAFNNFTIIDSLNQKATINGKVLTTNYKDYRFALDIKTDNFRALHSTAADNDLIYGTVFLSSNIKIRGDLNQPDVNMNINVNKGTKFFFALPTGDPGVIDQKGIVEFIDADAPPFNGEKSLKVDSVSKSPIKGLNLVAKVVIDPEAELNVVVDPANGDALNIKGNANLNATIDPSGKISLTGRYEVIDGSYNLSVGPLGKKEFKLQKGSTIVWTGDPTQANIDLTAVYEVNAAPIDLLGESATAQAKTKLPFQVYLMMKGELLKPIISFRLDLPENERNALDGTVYAAVQNVNRNESELNKQVFALLALNRFIANNPFQSLAGGGGGVSTLARQSVSKLLTEQLNNLASDLIQGVDLNFGVNSSEDYSSGSLQQKTDLQVGLSKKLLNDRLTVSVGSTFNVEGPQTPGQKSTDIAGNVNVEYALSADGRYRLRAYRRNQNEAILEGQIIETGLGFTLVVDYNKFKEIFQSKKKRRLKLQQKPKNETTN
ncbi:translocation/assembly module TamB domain-containing protein [Pedobacter sp. UYP30]|uniref:translocation/assembly module TamB domain-containing protein n=1 Tax=Pedobacter sp. UYP30 TaxID=1756400 RepID=UPI00339B2212